MKNIQQLTPVDPTYYGLGIVFMTIVVTNSVVLKEGLSSVPKPAILCDLEFVYVYFIIWHIVKHKSSSRYSSSSSTLLLHINDLPPTISSQSKLVIFAYDTCVTIYHSG